ncbi:MAG: zinc ribbon domain-containing protein [Clostridia bacterium]|nr:zinc ribbon domain-containing protein [Clostridia bacterium]
MYCRKCGKQIDDEAVVCPHCGVLTIRRGAGFYGQPAQPVQPVQYYNAPGQQPAQIVIQPVRDTEQKGTNGLGIAGFIIGLLSIIFGMYFCIPAVAGFILSLFAVINRKRFKSCNGLAIAALVISSVALALWFGLWAAFLITLIIG